MRKSVSALLLVGALIIGLPFATLAANQVQNIHILAVLQEDGSMHVTQTWEGHFGEGTEVYIPMQASDHLTISGLLVSDQNGRFTTVSDWDVNGSFEEKARKAGINPVDNGYEICFGISQYGQNRYCIEYSLDNVFTGYTDRDGANFRFVNDQMNTTPTNVTVQILLADGTQLTDEIADIWAFGYDGVLQFEDGEIIARTENPLAFDNHVTVLISLEKGLITPTRQIDESFDLLKERAFSGSDYDSPSEEEDLTITDIIVSVLTLSSPFVIFVWLRKLKKRREKKRQQKFSEQFGYFRDVPNAGNLSASYALGKIFNLCDEGAILATGILRLVQLGCLAPVETQKVGFMGKSKETVHLKLMSSHHDKMDVFDEFLYTVLEGAAGADGILQEKELERFAEQNDTLLRDYIRKHESAGRDYLNKKRCLKNYCHKTAKLKDLTPSGKQELGELMGLKRYLADFSLIAERGIKEIPIWRELLTYAMLFGIADQVAEQMKSLYPALSAELAEYSTTMNSAYAYHYVLYSNMRKAEQNRVQQTRSAGGGGFASFGGGGGFSGGSSGGGTR